jgi:hypothetical protein
VTARFESGVDAFDAARDIGRALGLDERFSELGEFGRIAVNVETVYRTLDPGHVTPDVVNSSGEWLNLTVPDQAARRVAIDRRTARVHPTTTARAKMNHCTA